MSTKIEWCEETWNPVTGCTAVSAGCENCYAGRMANRLRGRYGYPQDEPFKVTLHPDRLNQPLRWRKPRRIFVCSMGDLFHEDVPTKFINSVFDTTNRLEHHTFLFLTKRIDRMREEVDLFLSKRAPREMLPHQQFGVSISTQPEADAKIPILLQIAAATRLVSVEPMLGPVDLVPWLTVSCKRCNNPIEVCACSFGGVTEKQSAANALRATRPGLSWVICGAETGPGARPMRRQWAYDLLGQCEDAKVPFFFKKTSDGGRQLYGRLWEQYPERSQS